MIAKIALSVEKSIPNTPNRNATLMIADIAEPSICMVAPRGSTMSVTSLLMPVSSATSMLVGMVATEALFRPCLARNGILDWFDAICSVDEVGKGKNSPDVFLRTAEKLGVAPEECVVFDDVLPAVRSAKQAGMKVCAVYEKHSAHSRAEMEQAADWYLEKITDAPEFGPAAKH